VGGANTSACPSAGSSQRVRHTINGRGDVQKRTHTHAHTYCKCMQEAFKAFSLPWLGAGHGAVGGGEDEGSAGLGGEEEEEGCKEEGHEE